LHKPHIRKVKHSIASRAPYVNHSMCSFVVISPDLALFEDVAQLCLPPSQDLYSAPDQQQKYRKNMARELAVVSRETVAEKSQANCDSKRTPQQRSTFATKRPGVSKPWLLGLREEKKAKEGQQTSSSSTTTSYSLKAAVPSLLPSSSTASTVAARRINSEPKAFVSKEISGNLLQTNLPGQVCARRSRDEISSGISKKVIEHKGENPKAAIGREKEQKISNASRPSSNDDLESKTTEGNVGKEGEDSSEEILEIISLDNAGNTETRSGLCYLDAETTRMPKLDNFTIDVDEEAEDDDDDSEFSGDIPLEDESQQRHFDSSGENKGHK